MTMTTWIVALLAGAAGVVQAALLRRAAHLGPRPVGVFARLLLVGVVLVAAAAVGRLPAGAAGWGIGFAACTCILAWRSR